MNTAVLAISLSVLMHVSWNLLARHVSPKCNYLWWGLLAHLVILGPWAVWRLVNDSHWGPDLYWAILVTALANTTYFLALRKAYFYAPVALVYPVARSSPVLIALWAWLIFDQDISASGITGIAISVTGLWILSLTSRHGDSRHAIPWALVAALSTSVYSLSDKVAVEYLPSFGSQLGFITVGYFASFLALTLVEFNKNKKFYPACRPKLKYIAIGGLFIGTAYALVVRAMLELPAAYVVAYTNAGIVIATIFSIWLFKEKESWRMRMFGVTVVCLGLLWTGVGQ